MREATHSVEVERDVKVTHARRRGAPRRRVPSRGARSRPDHPRAHALRTCRHRRVRSDGRAPRGAGVPFVLQAVRGTDGSEGDQSFFAERDDGRATAEWLTTQAWWDGRLATYGSSYMGFTQWALASTAPSYLRAMVIALSSTHSSWYLGGTLALELMINWDLSALELPPPGAGRLRHGDRTRRDRTQAAHAPGGVRPPAGG